MTSWASDQQCPLSQKTPAPNFVLKNPDLCTIGEFGSFEHQLPVLRVTPPNKQPIFLHSQSSVSVFLGLLHTGWMNSHLVWLHFVQRLNSPMLSGQFYNIFPQPKLYMKLFPIRTMKRQCRSKFTEQCNSDLCISLYVDFISKKGKEKNCR